MRTCVIALCALAPFLFATAAHAQLIVSSHNSDEVYRYNATNGALIGVLVTNGTGGLGGPHGVAIGPDRNLYLASADTDEIFRIDPTNGVLIDTFVTNNSGSLLYPAGILFGPDGHLYVTSQDNDRILRFHGLTGAFIDTFVTNGSGGLNGPSCIMLGPDTNFYVTGRYDDRLYRYNAFNGAFIDIFVTNQLSQPFGCDFGPDGNLYVASGNEGTIKRFDGTTGEYMDDFASGVSFPVQFIFGPDSNIYACSFSHNSVRRYNGTTGVFVDSFVTAGSGGLNGPNFLTFVPPGTGPLDSDGDGMPDYWEILHTNAGLLAGISNAPNANGDGDVYTDLEEYIADTLPGDSNSFPRVGEISINSPPVITFDASTARVYTLQFITDLFESWSNVPEQVAVSATGTVHSMTDANAFETNKHYRLRIALPD